MLRAERRFSSGLKIRITVAGVSTCFTGFQEFCHARALTLTAHAEATLEGIEAGGSLDETTATVRPGKDTRNVLYKTVGLGSVSNGIAGRIRTLSRPMVVARTARKVEIWGE